MSASLWLVMYCVLVMVFSLGGGWAPFLLGKLTHSKLQFYLSLSAGVMLGAAFFHLMPEASEQTGGGFWFGLWMSVGVVGLFCVERFIAPHSHEVGNGSHGAAESHVHTGHEHDHHHEPTAAAPTVAGWMAVLGLTIHTFINGAGLAAAVVGKEAAVSWPGIAVFFAIVFHKPFDALAISTVLSRKEVSRKKISLVQIGFAFMVPAGVVAFLLTEGAIAEDLQKPFMGAALAISAGTFLFIALADLLPEVQFHKHDRVPLFLLLLAGVVVMAGIAFLEPHDHDNHKPDHEDHTGHAPSGGEQHHDHDHDHDKHPD